MAENSAISWCDHTQNFWIGCTKVGPGCDHCYAERDNARRKWVEGWGPGAPRRRTKTWGDPLRWDRAAALMGRRPRIFCSSLADFFDNEVDPAWRTEAWGVIRCTPHLRWMILTKRIGNAAKMLPLDWPLSNVGLLATVVNQAEADRDIPKLLATPAMWRGLSIEPMLGPVDISHWLTGHEGIGLDWVICGGESGPHARPMHPSWPRSLRDQCAAAGVAFHFKQWGEWAPHKISPGNRGQICLWPNGREGAGIGGANENGGGGAEMDRVGKKRAGDLLDGREHKEFPAALEASPAPRTAFAADVGGSP
ncbi:phage Gp37/Gp68 family protein [Afipia carboxidovorans]|uniref:DUF5131 family protein n=1 Tax=Afipia carboxidovorans TaxID=40137 RepID=UPI00308772D3|nr:phage Gp37/Gp68 family protein [Afipia carboxidovorans]